MVDDASFCSSCGHNLATDANFCTGCGRSRAVCDPSNVLTSITGALDPASVIRHAASTSKRHVPVGRVITGALLILLGIPVAVIAYVILDGTINGDRITTCCFENSAKGAWGVHEVAIRGKFPGFDRGFKDPRGPGAQLGDASDAKVERLRDDSYKITSHFIQLPTTLSRLHEIGYEKTDYSCVLRFIKPNEWRVVSLTSTGPVTLPYSSLVDGSHDPSPAAQKPAFQDQWMTANSDGIAAFERGDYEAAKQHFGNNLRELQSRLHDPFREKREHPPRQNP